MFNLANIFGIGKADTENPSSLNLNDNNHSCPSSPSSDTAYSENDLGDWILIDPEIEKKNESAVATVTAEESAVKQIRKSKKKSKGKHVSEKVQSLEESSWHIDPPECFKSSSESKQVKTSSSLENLLIEIPNMSVFENFFTKKIFIINEEPIVKKPNPLELTTFGKKNRSNGAKENANPVTARTSKKKQLEIAANVPPVYNQKNKALTANINGEIFSKKNYEKITKKNYKRQNLVAKQRNGPIIRKQKMFTHLNGAYHTRNQNF